MKSVIGVHSLQKLFYLNIKQKNLSNSFEVMSLKDKFYSNFFVGYSNKKVLSQQGFEPRLAEIGSSVSIRRYFSSKMEKERNENKFVTNVWLGSKVGSSDE